MLIPAHHSLSFAMKTLLGASLLLLSACQNIAPNDEVDSTRLSRSFGFVYNAELSDIAADSKQVRIWIPIPSNTHDQEITDLHVVGKAGESTFEFSASDLEGDELEVQHESVVLMLRPIENGQGRSLCVESKGQPIEVELSFRVRRYETTPHKYSGIEEASYLGSASHIPLDGNVSEVAKGLSTDSNPLLAARQLYDHTLDRMRYDKPAGGGWGKGDAEWACDSRHGNCTDFHSYFMGLARSKNIPARFEMGFPISAGGEEEAEVTGYHCWAYFWIEDQGWVPVDISEADKHPEKAEYFFGKIDEHRVAMSGGRDLLLTPRPAVGSLNFLIYPYAEVDGKPTSKVKKSFKRILLSE